MVSTPVNQNCTARKSRPREKDTDDQESRKDTDQNDNNLSVNKTNLKRSLSANAGINRRKVGIFSFRCGIAENRKELWCPNNLSIYA